MTDTSLERRRELRVAVALAVEVRLGPDFTLLSCRDLSTGGLFFDRSIPHAVGTPVGLEFSLPGDSEPIRCSGRVVNVPDAHEFGMGIHFEKLTEADRARIDAFVHEHSEEQA